VIEARPGDVYRITSFHVTDGDTIRAHLADEAIIAQDRGRVRPGWDMEVDARFWTRKDLPGVLGKYGPPIRLVTLNTPEIGQPGHQEALDQLRWWLERQFSYPDGLSVEVWPDEGAFGRYLGDVFVTGRRTWTASEFMLSNGWLPYLGARPASETDTGEGGASDEREEAHRPHVYESSERGPIEGRTEEERAAWIASSTGVQGCLLCTHLDGGVFCEGRPVQGCMKALTADICPAWHRNQEGWCMDEGPHLAAREGGAQLEQWEGVMAPLAVEGGPSIKAGEGAPSATQGGGVPTCPNCGHGRDVSSHWPCGHGLHYGIEDTHSSTDARNEGSSEH
jgi:endonuclease YncB( thermonuclease family)